MILIDFIFQQGHFVSMSLLNLNVDNLKRFYYNSHTRCISQKQYIFVTYVNSVAYAGKHLYWSLYIKRFLRRQQKLRK